eukprot:5809480-Pyramimonas_sp.AAC.2
MPAPGSPHASRCQLAPLPEPTGGMLKAPARVAGRAGGDPADDRGGVVLPGGAGAVTAEVPPCGGLCGRRPRAALQLRPPHRAHGGGGLKELAQHCAPPAAPTALHRARRALPRPRESS